MCHLLLQEQRESGVLQPCTARALVQCTSCCVHCDICRHLDWSIYYTMALFTIPWHYLLYHGIIYYTMALFTIPWHYIPIPWHYLLYHGIIYYTMVYPSTEASNIFGVRVSSYATVLLMYFCGHSATRIRKIIMGTLLHNPNLQELFSNSHVGESALHWESDSSSANDVSLSVDG